jgi:GT2 family glycosyltransferase
MKKKTRTYIIIINWNGFKDTIKCLDSLTIISHENLSILVVDNGSTDKSVQEIEKAHPEVNIIKLKTNTGFTGGCNAGIHAALRNNANYIFLLNNDTLIDDEMLIDRMINYLEANTDVGIVSPIVLNYPEGKIWFGGGHLDRNTGIIQLEKRGDKYHKPLTESATIVTFLYGCALFVRADLLRKVNGFYEPYFLTSEESELCIKAMDLGYKLALLENVYLFHKVAQSMIRGSFLWSYFLYRNKLIFIKRNAIDFSIADLFKVLLYYMRGLAGFLRNGNYSAAVGLIKGVLDFALGREGKGYFEKKL